MYSHTCCDCSVIQTCQTTELEILKRYSQMLVPGMHSLVTFIVVANTQGTTKGIYCLYGFFVCLFINVKIS